MELTKPGYHISNHKLHFPSAQNFMTKNLGP